MKSQIESGHETRRCVDEPLDRHRRGQDALPISRHHGRAAACHLDEYRCNDGDTDGDNWGDDPSASRTKTKGEVAGKPACDQ